MTNFTFIHYLLLFIVTWYGFILGFKNIYYRLFGFFLGLELKQSDLGRVLDIIFLLFIAYLILVFKGVL